jgi:hypothetical protein
VYGKDETNPKFSVCYLYDDNQGASFDFRALSSDRWLKDDFVFFAIDNPSSVLRSHIAGHLPAITGTFRQNENQPAGSAFFLNG